MCNVPSIILYLGRHTLEVPGQSILTVINGAIRDEPGAFEPESEDYRVMLHVIICICT
jgi:hypothetical protein